MKTKNITTAEFAAMLVAFRERNGWSQSKACTALGFQLRTLQNWEQGRNMPSGYALSSILRLIEPPPES